MSSAIQISQHSNTFVETLKDTLQTFIDPQLKIFQRKGFTDILQKINQLNKNQKKLNHEKVIQTILQLNYNCLYQLRKLVQKSEKFQKTVPQLENLQISIEDYKILQEAVQKAQNQVRHHIGTQHQMKILIDQLDQEISSLKKKSENQQKQNKFYRKQISFLKQKEIEFQKQIKLMKTECALLANQIKKKNSRISTYEESQGKILENKILKKKQISIGKKVKILTQPSKYNKYDNQFMEEESIIKTKNLEELQSKKKGESSNSNPRYASRMNSKKSSQINFLQGNINVNLTNLVTIQSYNVVENKQDQKDHFWNRRRRIKVSHINQCYDKKQKQAQNLYKRYGIKQQKNKKGSNLNKSLNISPKKQLFIQNTIDLKPQIQRRKINVVKHKTQGTEDNY